MIFKVLQIFSIHKQQPSTGVLLNSFSENFKKKPWEKIQAGHFSEKIQLKPLSKFLENAQAVDVAHSR